MNEYVSKKLSALSLVAMILVVFIHSQNEEVAFASGEWMGGAGWVLFIENFVSKGVARIAVPLFFAISGYLFYQSYSFTPSGVITKMRGRFRTLLIPYLFWSVFGLLLFLAMQSIPWSKGFFTKQPVADYSTSQLINTVLVNPIPYQLWFVRDLIMLVIFSPLIWYLTKYIRVAWMVILTFLWLITPKSMVLFSNEALLFFSLGCALAIDQANLATYRVSRLASYGLFVTWLGLIFLTTSLVTYQMDGEYVYTLNNLAILLGISAVWSLYDYAGHRLFTNYSAVFGYTFIIFVFHEPLLTILKKGMFFLLGTTNLTALFIYLVAPLLAIGMSMLFRYVMRKHVPRIYDLATGGR